MKEISMSNHHRLEVLDLQWNQEQTKMLKFCMTKKKNKKMNTLFKRLNQLEDNVKEKIIKAYLEKCKMKYAVKFFEYRKRISKTNNSLACFLHNIKKRSESEKLLDNYLFKGIDSTILDVDLHYA